MEVIVVLLMFNIRLCYLKMGYSKTNVNEQGNKLASGSRNP
jgi:hypothetical protein